MHFLPKKMTMLFFKWLHCQYCALVKVWAIKVVKTKTLQWFSCGILVKNTVFQLKMRPFKLAHIYITNCAVILPITAQPRNETHHILYGTDCHKVSLWQQQNTLVCGIFSLLPTNAKTLWLYWDIKNILVT